MILIGKLLSSVSKKETSQKYKNFNRRKFFPKEENFRKKKQIIKQSRYYHVLSTHIDLITLFKDRITNLKSSITQVVNLYK